MQGFVGQRQFIVKKSSHEHTHTEAFTSLKGILEADQIKVSEESTRPAERQQSFLLTLISRRSTKRSGLRYLRRGIDDSGNCANAVETEQILSSPTWDRSAKYRCFVQIRGSIPLYFSQSPYSLKPVPILHQSAATNQAAFLRHFEDLRDRYGSVQIALLVDKHGSEAKIGEEYEQVVKRVNERKDSPQLGFEWFDFHAECRGMKFENVVRLVNTLRSTIKSFGESVLQDGVIHQRQTGILRTNCMDCLDRTNVAQSAFAQFILQEDLEDEGFEIDLFHDESTQWFNTLWADNGDAISREYASTAALKGDFTRTRKRNYRGAVSNPYL
jgi:SacI homology domain